MLYRFPKALFRSGITIRYFTRLAFRLSAKWSIINVLLSFLRGMVPLAFIFAVKFFLDIVSASVHQGEAAMGKILLTVGGIVLPLFLLRIMQEIWQPYANERLVKLIKDEIFRITHKKSVRVGLADYDTQEYQDLFHRVSTDTHHRPGRIITSLGMLAQSVLALGAIAVLLMRFHAGFTLLLLLLFIPVITVHVRYALKQYKQDWERAENQRKEAYYNHVLTSKAFAGELRLFNLATEFCKRFARQANANDRARLGLLLQNARQQMLVQGLMVLILTGMMVFVSIQAVTGEISASMMVLLILALHRAIMFFQGLKQSLALLAEDSQYLQDFLKFKALPEREMDAQPNALRNKAIDKAPEIRFEHVSFTYPENPSPTLHNISFTIPAGQTVVLAGANGSGKTTLALLLAGLYRPDSGSIYIDGTTTENWAPQALRRSIGMLFQNYILYNASLRDNILFGDWQRPQDSAHFAQAATFSGVDTVARTLPNGYDTLIGTLFRQSHELSVGQWQKIAIARTLYKDAPVAVFDEPNSALDSASERAFFENMGVFIQNKTALLVLHRFTAFHKKHRLLVLQEGKLAEDGYFDALMRRKGTLWGLYKHHL